MEQIPTGFDNCLLSGQNSEDNTSFDNDKVHYFKIAEEHIADSISKALDYNSSDISFIRISNGNTYGENVYKRIAPPPISFDVWARTLLLSSRLNRCCRTVARNVVGLGWDVLPKKEINKDTPQEILKAIEDEIEIVKEFFENANTDVPFTTLMYCIKQDQEVLGNGYLEIVRNGKGDMIELNAINPINMRVLKDRRGYVRINDNGSFTFFKRLGITEKEVIEKYEGAVNTILSKVSGRFVGEYINDDKTEREPTPILPDKATELLHFKHYTTLDPYYGIPKYIASDLAITGTRLANKRNMNFFHNDAVPRMAVVVSNGELTTHSKEDVEQFFQQGKGVENSQRVLVIEGKKVGPGEQIMEGTGTSKGVNIQLVPLTVGINEDANHLKYIKENKEELREDFGLPQIYFSSTDINKASSNVSKKITDEQEFDPERKEYEFLINHKLLKPKPFDIKYVKLVFNRPDTVDLVEKGQFFSLMTRVAGLTPNEIRKDIGKPAYPKDYIFGDKPLAISVPEMQMGLAPATIGNPKMENLPTNNQNPLKPGDQGRPATSPNNISSDAKDPSEQNPKKSMSFRSGRSFNTDFVLEELLEKINDLSLKIDTLQK